MRARKLLALALLATSSLGFSWRPWMQGGTGAGGAAGSGTSSVLGIIPASADITVYSAMIDASPNIFERVRAAGAGWVYIYMDPDGSESDYAAGVLGALGGHPIAIGFPVWNLSSLGGNNPASCDPDWTTSQCRTDLAEAAGNYCSYLRRGDLFFVGNEQDDYFASHASEIPSHRLLVLAIQAACHAHDPGIKVGIVTSHDTADENTISTLWDPAFDVLGVNAYANLPGFQIGTAAQGLAALEDAITFCHTLTDSCAVPETGMPSSANTGSSESQQAQWARMIHNRASSLGALMISAFIAADGVLPGANCDTAGSGIGGTPGSDASEDYVCSAGLLRSDLTPKEAWCEWWYGGPCP